MKCAWDALLQVIPPNLRQTVDTQGKLTLNELRLRCGQPIEMVTKSGSHWLKTSATKDDINYVISSASRYSPWSVNTISQGYFTINGGHRVGVCGEAIMKGDAISGFRTATSLCIRVARDYPGISKGAEKIAGNLLILGPPGCGKTTLLRDLIREKSNRSCGSIAVVDERGEIFPQAGIESGFPRGIHTDVICGCDKETGIELVLRTMGPEWIAVDEITAKQDCDAMIHAGWCGVGLMATTHATDLQDLLHRPVYRTLLDTGLFHQAIVLKRDKTWRWEEIPNCK